MAGALRLLQKTGSTAVAARRVALQMIRADTMSAPEEPRDQLRGAARMRPMRHLAATRPDSTDFKTPLGAARMAPRRPARRCAGLDDEVSGPDEMIAGILRDSAPLPPGCGCVGPQSAARPMVTAGDNPERPGPGAAFAMPCGAAPVPAPSGTARRHRPSRGGDGAADRALHIVAIGRPRTDSRTQEYVAGKPSEGHTKPEAARCLKRYIAREVYYVIRNQRKLVNCP